MKITGDLQGKKFGKLSVIGKIPITFKLRVAGPRTKSRFKWLCECECGKRTEALGRKLVSGRKQSCGCVKKSFFSTTHGMTGTPTYGTWVAMVRRCTNPKWRAFHRYGGRGIKVCDAWMIFENFAADMGERPAGKTLDRINPDGHYEPTNCRWATQREQCNNKGNKK